MFLYFESVSFRDPLSDEVFLLTKRKILKLGGIDNLVGLNNVINMFFISTNI